MFICNKCKKNFLTKNNSCCPRLYKKIINYPEDKDYDLEYPFIDKYIRTDTGFPPETSTIQYTNFLKKINLKQGTVLDFGCCHGHASSVIKNFSTELKYIGVDQEINYIIPGSKMYSEADFFYLCNPDNKKTLKYIVDNSVDILFVSRLTQWDNYLQFIPEFYRVLKSGGHLIFYGNRGWPFYEQRRYLFNELTTKYGMKKEEASVGCWGIKNSYLKNEDELSIEEQESAIRLMAKKI